MSESREYPGRPFVAVAAIICRDSGGSDDDVLLIQRGKAPSYGRWSIPGGAVEVGETLREAVAREVMEECGIEIELGPVAEIIDRIVPDDEGRVRFHYVILDFAARYRSGEAKAGSDSIGARWVPLADLEQYDLTQQTIEVIRKAAQMLGQAGSASLTGITNMNQFRGPATPQT